MAVVRRSTRTVGIRLKAKLDSVRKLPSGRRRPLMVQRYPLKARGTITRQSLLVTVLLSSNKSAGIETPTDPLVGIETPRRHHNLWL